MKLQRSFLSLVLALAASVAAQNVQLSGTVTNAIGGAPLKNVVVSLKNRPTLKDTTGVDGKYSISGTTTVLPSVSEYLWPGTAQLRGHILEFSTQGFEPVTVDIFTASGARIASIFKNTLLAPGAYHIDLARHNMVSGLYLVRYHQGEMSSVFSCASTSSSHLQKQLTANNQALSVGAYKRSAAVVDTLTFTLAGFTTAHVAITSYSCVHDIALVPTNSAHQKWTPGWCVELDVGSGGGGLSGWLAQIAAIKNEANITSVCYRDRWAKYEDAAGGTYTVGFNTVDQLQQACALAGKKLFLALMPEAYGGSVPSSASGVLPNYFETLQASDGQAPAYVKWPGGTPWSGSLVIAPMIWDSVVIEKFNAMTRAYAARYEGNATVAMMHGPGESSIGVPNGMRGFSSTKMCNSYKSWMLAARAVFPTTMLRLEVNWVDTDPNMQSLLDAAIASKVVVGGPDIRPSATVQANRIWNGSSGGKDYRALGAFCAEIQGGTSYSGLTPTTAMPALYNFEETGTPAKGGSTQAQIIMVIRNTWTGPSGNYPIWDANILPFIRQTPITHTQWPAGW